MPPLRSRFSPPLTLFYPPLAPWPMGVAIGRPVRGPPAADSRARRILLAAAQSPPSPRRGCSLDDALSSRCFKRWQLNKNLFGVTGFLPSFSPPPPKRRLRSTNKQEYPGLLAPRVSCQAEMTHADMVESSAPNRLFLLLAMIPQSELWSSWNSRC